MAITKLRVTYIQAAITSMWQFRSYVTQILCLSLEESTGCDPASMNYLGDKPRGFLHQRTNLLTLTPSILLNALKKVEVVVSVSVNSLRPTGICFKPSVSILLLRLYYRKTFNEV